MADNDDDPDGVTAGLSLSDVANLLVNAGKETEASFSLSSSIRKTSFDGGLVCTAFGAEEGFLGEKNAAKLSLEIGFSAFFFGGMAVVFNAT